MTGAEHAISFGGTIVVGELPPSQPGTLTIADAGLLDGEPHVVVQGRPTIQAVEQLADSALARGAERVVAVGCGATLDAAKLIAIRAETKLVLVPCGAEPYRAVARFAVVDDAECNRPTVVDERFARGTVILAPRLLERLAPDTVATHALDTAVQATESLLSTQRHPFARTQALSALTAVSQETAGAATSTDARLRVVIASFQAVESFSSTRLGIAHALASPLGTALGVTHDTINGILGEPVVRHWGDRVAGFDDVASGLGVAPRVDAVTAELARLRGLAGLPATLRDHGVLWENVEGVLPRAARSSGISVLPDALDDDRLRSFARQAWGANIDEEVLDVQPA
jgi:alcohol dehydrogenase class IV